MSTTKRGRGRPPRADWMTWVDLQSLAGQGGQACVHVDAPGSHSRRTTGRLLTIDEQRMVLRLRDGSEQTIGAGQFRRARWVPGLFADEDLVLLRSTLERGVVVRVSGTSVVVEFADGRQIELSESRIIHGDDYAREQMRGRLATPRGPVPTNATLRKAM